MRAAPLVAALAVLAAGALLYLPREEASTASVALSGAPAWEALAEVPAPRTEAQAVAAGGRVYVLGGLFPAPGGVGALVTGRVDVFDPETGEWSAGPTLPVPLHHTAPVAVGDRIVVAGGHTSPGPFFVARPETWWLDAALPLVEQRWQVGPPMPVARGAHAAATDGTRVWVFGGVNHLAVGAAALEPSVYRNDDPFDPNSPWARVADFPDPRDHLGGAFLDGKVLAVAGRDLSFETNTGRLDAYDPVTDAWTEAAPMPTPRGGVGAVAVAGRLVVVGGEATSGTFAEVEAFDPATGAWAALPPLPEPRHGVGAAALDGALHALAGGPEPGFTYSGTHERLTIG